MAGNLVTIVIKASNQAKGAFDETSKALKGLVDDGKATKAEMAAAGATILGVITAIGTTAVTKFAEFEASMSKVKAVTDATTTDMALLTEQAKALGASTVFTAKEVADAMAELGQAGFKTSEIMEAIPATLNLAAAGGLEIARATEIASSTLRGFQIETKNTTHVVDVMAAVAATSNATIESFGDSMKYLAPTAHAFGISIEEASAAVGFLANAGIHGSLATRALGTSLANLTKPTDAMVAKMQELDIHFFDAQGNFIGMAGLIKELERSLKGLTQEQRMAAIATLFGAESIQEINVLLAEGSDKLIEYTKQLEGADGEAKRMADTMLDNLKGSFEKLSGAIDTLWINLGQILAPTVRMAADAITVLADAVGKALTWFQTLPAPIQTVVKAVVGVLVGVLALAAGWAVLSVTLGGFWLAFTGIIAAAGTFLVAFWPIIAVIAAITAVVYGLYWAWTNNFGGMRDYIMEWVPIIQDAFSNFFTFVKFLFDTYMVFMGGWVFGLVAAIRGGWDNIVAIVKAALDIVWQVIQFVFNAISGLVKMTLQIIGGDFSGAWATWTDTADKMGKNLMNIFADIFTIIKETIIGALEAIKNFFTGWFDYIFGKIETLWNWITKIGDNISSAESAKKTAERAKNSSTRRMFGGFVPDLPAFNFGGVVSGARGIDNVPILATAGEVILNHAQQSNVARSLESRGGGGDVYIDMSNSSYFGDDQDFIGNIADKVYEFVKPHLSHEAY